MARYITFKKIRQQVFILLSNLPFIPGHKWRPLLIRLGGVNIDCSQATFVGRNVSFDAVHPEYITIEKGVRITDGTVILTHYYNPMNGQYTNGNVIIKECAFIGAGTIITKPITIGSHSCVGAGSVVTKDIPDYEVWAGNPAHFIKQIPH